MNYSVLNMIQDEGLRLVRAAFKTWVKVCREDALKEFQELKAKETMRKYNFYYLYLKNNNN